MKTTITIVCMPDGVDVGMSVDESVYPTTHYETKRLAVARVLQLLDLGPVGPQSHPESVCIGEINGEALPSR